ncbi:peptidase family C78-domain-containing protein [Aspergillus multicolor]|uniref:peptidase family C78-domain-containing protein n=1 Tax=Aspergillus multicolor TaxID=41759 RepID=UPI003CCCC362
MEAQSTDDSICPFCPFFDRDSNFVTQHVRYCHPENESSAESQEPSQPTSRTSLGFQLSTTSNLGIGDQCGSTRQDYAKLGDPAVPRHAPFLQTVGTTSLRVASSNDQDEQRIRAKKLSNIAIKKLGRAELGPFAHEKKMPSWLFRLLEKEHSNVKFNKITLDGKLSRHAFIENETPHVVPALAQLCRQDKSVQRAFLCSSHVHHISKMPREGGFCGYRNIQMLVSYIRGSGACNLFPTLPTILQLQDMIERAWDMGYNAMGRTETGGVKGTRKYIGTSEAQAFFLSLGIHPKYWED